jgi:hypothetical protein
MSLLYIYKAMESKHKAPDFSGIGNEFVPDNDFHFVLVRFSLFCKNEFIPWLLRWTRVKLPRLWTMKAHASPTAGPNAPMSILSYPLDTLYWVFRGFKDSPLFNYWTEIGDRHNFEKFCTYAQITLRKAFGPQEGDKIWEQSCSGMPVAHDAEALAKAFPDYATLEGPDKRHLKKVIRPRGGKLSLIKEASGKVRVVAIVDSWTQTTLRPIHDYLFDLLKGMPCDGTFDQQGSVKSFAEEGHKELFSYDLKAATDTIPYLLYVEVLAPLLGRGIASAWLELLRNRSWLLPNWQTVSKAGKTMSKPLTYLGKRFIKYGRGQPMGALSSWGALALLHHAVVQYSAFLVGQFPFSDYRVLGDDIVIAGRAVARSYRETCSHLGIVVGLPKSFVSTNGFFNFANQSYLDKANISPISFKAEISANSGHSRLALACQAIERGWIDMDSANFFSQVLRWMLPPSLVREVEATRKSGRMHEAAYSCANLIFRAAIDGVSPLTRSGGLGVLEIASGFVNPGVSLFSMKLATCLQATLATRWSAVELLSALVDIQTKHLRTVLRQKLDELESFIFIPEGSVLYEPVSLPPEWPPYEPPPEQWEINIDAAQIKYPSRIETAEGDSYSFDDVKPLFEIDEMMGVMSMWEVIKKVHTNLFLINMMKERNSFILKMAPDLALSNLSSSYALLLSTEKEMVNQNLSMVGKVESLPVVTATNDSLYTGLLLAEHVRELMELGVKDHRSYVSPSLDLERLDQLDKLTYPENQRLLILGDE